MNLKNYLSDLVSLIFPEVCEACCNSLFRHEKYICNLCIVTLPKTDFHLNKDNPVSKLFIGRINIETASAYYIFQKGSNVQYLMYQLKYKGKKEVAEIIGINYGAELALQNEYKNIDYIIPVPLHPNKQRKRGYNQSEWFANGLSYSLKTKVLNNILIRNTETETQTKKERFDRWINVNSMFNVTEPSLLYNKNILLVDDVITTGATIEACSQELLKIKGVQLTIAAIAFANH